MFSFNEDHLRITKPISINGVAPKIVDGKVVNRIIHLPLTAEKGLKESNSRLPEGLKMKIEKIPGYTPAPAVVETNNKEMEDLKAELEQLRAEKAARKPTGRPKKIVQNEV